MKHPLASLEKLEIHHVRALVRALHELSLVDGQHDSEQALLRCFYDTCHGRLAAPDSFEDIVREPLDSSTLSRVFDSAELRTVFLQCCLYLAFADGRYTGGERQRIEHYATALQVSPAALVELENEVAGHLMEQLAKKGRAGNPEG
ncbi:hypothetical protein OOT46_05365 [Aquabacterium sp. A7-Y]|uniref:hypothetical protein n=1 Tax=Aquabacterium sp. A7-Y TaxID=1349605 RepID=UPI00223D4359|nr:hypothetical protein [Aquabacterium sp. A7-Y]MCW7537279.1 hypothetical protein [Aquabacterium sp. A7-Y]